MQLLRTFESRKNSIFHDARANLLDRKRFSRLTLFYGRSFVEMGSGGRGRSKKVFESNETNQSLSLWFCGRTKGHFFASEWPETHSARRARRILRR